MEMRVSEIGEHTPLMWPTGLSDKLKELGVCFELLDKGLLRAKGKYGP